MPIDHEPQQFKFLTLDVPGERIQRDIVDAAKLMQRNIKPFRRGDQFGSGATLEDLTKKPGDYMTNFK
jgi:hypothetical protein